MGTSTTDINISLEPHLVQSLRDILPVLPTDHAQALNQHLANPQPPVIPYSVLFTISQWTRSESAQILLKSKNLDHHDYSMIALLAGTTTSPERKFGDYTPPKDPEELEYLRREERKKITALLNALLSIGGVGFAAWCAADKTGWKYEWRVLFSLFAAILVAISEASLYLIWQSYRSKPKESKSRPRYREKSEPPPLSDTSNDTTKPKASAIEDTATLRQRK